MSLDLYAQEVRDREVAAPKASVPEASMWDGFARGTGMSALQTFAKAGRAASMALAAPVVATDYLLGDGTTLQDRYFKWHDETFGDAVDYWTPKPDEVGVAGQITGQLLATIPLAIASPEALVAATGLGTAEDLARKGVEPTKAIAAGEVQAAGLGLGIYVPVLGQTLAQRVLLGGAGFNVFQGVATRGASQAILSGTAGEKDFEAFDPTAVTLDALMGAAFGAIAHISPSQRAAGSEMLGKLVAWADSLKPSDVDALLVMRQAQHLNADSLPGKPADPQAVSDHVARAKQALEQLATDKQVAVEDLPKGQFEADPTRMQEMAQRAEQLQIVSEVVRKAEGLPDYRQQIEAYLFQQKVAAGEETVKRVVAEMEAKTAAESVPAFLRKAEELIALREDQAGANLEPVVKEAIDIAKKPGFQRTAEERIKLEAILGGKLADYMQSRNAAERNVLGDAVANVFAKRAEITDQIENAVVLRKEALARGDEAAAAEAKMNSDALKQQRATLDQEVLKKTEAPPARTSAEPPPPRGEGVRPGGAEANRIEVHLNPNEQGTFVTAQTDVGQVGAKIGNGVLKVITADIPEPANRGKGYGLAMYEELIKYAQTRGLRFVSDETVEAPAVRVYEKLKELGYDVKRNPAAKDLTGDAPGLFVPKGQSVFEVGGARRPSPKVAAPKAEAEADPLVSQARQFAEEQADTKITVGRDADGKPITKTLKAFLDESDVDVKKAEADSNLFMVAARCMLGGA